MRVSAYSWEDRGEGDREDGGSREWSSSSTEEKEDKKYVTHTHTQTHTHTHDLRNFNQIRTSQGRLAKNTVSQ